MAIEILESKDPNALNVNYKIDLSKYLQGTEIITGINSVIVDDQTIPTPQSQITDNGTSITVFLSLGTLGAWVKTTVEFTVSGGIQRTDRRSFRILIEEL